MLGRESTQTFDVGTFLKGPPVPALPSPQPELLEPLITALNPRLAPNTARIQSHTPSPAGGNQSQPAHSGTSVSVNKEQSQT